MFSSKAQRVHVSDDEKNILIHAMINHIVADGGRA